MSDYSPGQRWISDGEAELGLGTILNVDARSVTVLFGASQETRTYSSRNAPLTRVAFGSGEQDLFALRRSELQALAETRSSLQLRRAGLVEPALSVLEDVLQTVVVAAAALLARPP